MTNEFETGVSMAKGLPSALGAPLTDDADPAHAPGAVDTLKQAMRRARVDNAERAGVVADQRVMRLGRLELLQDELRPLVAQIPLDVDMFDIAIMPSANPRLFIDMIGFVEIGRDPKLYRLLQDTRHGRIKIAESEDIDTMVDAVTDYVARRLLERDKALAADVTREGTRRTKADAPSTGTGRPRTRRSNANAALVAETVSARSGGSNSRWLTIGFAFLIDLLGSIAFFTILAAIGWYIWNRVHTPI